MFKDLISLIFPQNCINCDRSLILEEKYLCTICKTDLPYTFDYQNQDNDLFKKFAFESKIKSASSFLYFYKHGVTQKLLHELKYRSKQDLGIILGGWFADQLSYHSIDTIIPVPLHKSKLKKRGFNQSDLIAKGLANSLGYELNTQSVSRVIATKSQTTKSKIQRWTDLENVYSEASESLQGKSVLLVDDVITTGATIGMLASRLIEVNVSEIHIACIARGK